MQQEQASNFTVATEAMACPFSGLAVVPSKLNKYYGMLNHVLALVPLRKLILFLKWPLCPSHYVNEI